MKILEYDQVNPMSVFETTMLALGFPLTPEHAEHIRRTDPRPFPCLSVCAVEDGRVVGHVGIFRLPMVTTQGREDMGGVWAVATHPQYAGRGVASRLLDEAHTRMRKAGLRFSTLGTSRSGGAYHLFLRHGYEDLRVWGTALARWETAHQPTRLSAWGVELARPSSTLRPTAMAPPGQSLLTGKTGYDFVEQVYHQAAKAYLGFAWRHTPFTRLSDKVPLDEISILWENDQPVGYALARIDRAVLVISNLLLKPGVDAAEAVAAVASRIKTAYVQVRTSRPAEMDSLRRAGYQVAHPDWGAFMLKPLLREGTVEEARCIMGIGSDRFLISWLDTT